MASTVTLPGPTPATLSTPFRRARPCSLYRSERASVSAACSCCPACSASFGLLVAFPLSLAPSGPFAAASASGFAGAVEDDCSAAGGLARISAQVACGASRGVGIQRAGVERPPSGPQTPGANADTHRPKVPQFETL